MRNYTHIAGGILLYVSFAYLVNLNNIIIGIFLAGAMSVFPDIIDRIHGEHKGIGHSIIWLVPLIIIGFINFYIGAALIIGFLSHILLDIFTFGGCPIIYPLSKTNFVALNKRNRIKTGTNQDKSLFVFIIFLLVPTLLLTTNHFSMLPNDQSIQLTTGEASGVPSNSYKSLSKSNINLNLQLNWNTTKNITFKQVNENESYILVKDLELGG